MGYQNDLVTTATSPGPPHAPLLLVNKLFPDAHLFFFAACDLSPPLASNGDLPVFLQMWDVNDARFGQPEIRDRAIIVPVGNNVDIGAGAAAWRFILFEMTVYKYNVRKAVLDLNATKPVVQYAVYGNQALHF